MFLVDQEVILVEGDRHFEAMMSYELIAVPGTFVNKCWHMF